MNIRKLTFAAVSAGFMTAVVQAEWGNGLAGEWKSPYVSPTQQSGWEHGDIEGSYKELRTAFENAHVAKFGRGVVVTFPELILFDSESSTVHSSGQREIKNMAGWMKNHPRQIVRVKGYTDSTGTSDYNRKLSEDRAQEVAKAISSQGISDHRITSAGYGERRPTAKNDSEEGRQANRRVEIFIQNP